MKFFLFIFLSFIFISCSSVYIEDGTNRGKFEDVNSIINDGTNKYKAVLKNEEKKEKEKVKSLSKKEDNSKTTNTSYKLPEGDLDFFYPLNNSEIISEEATEKGIDFKTKKNVNLKATAKGVVIFAGEKSGIGKTVFIYHNKGYISVFYNLSEINVSKGEYIKSTDNVIAKSSESFHLEIRKQEENSKIKILNPKKILQKRGN